MGGDPAKVAAHTPLAAQQATVDRLVASIKLKAVVLPAGKCRFTLVARDSVADFRAEEEGVPPVTSPTLSIQLLDIGGWASKTLAGCCHDIGDIAE